MRPQAGGSECQWQEEEEVVVGNLQKVVEEVPEEGEGEGEAHHHHHLHL